MLGARRLVLSGTKDGSDVGERYRRLLPDCRFMFVYGAGRAFIARDFFERRELFLISREAGSLP